MKKETKNTISRTAKLISDTSTNRDEAIRKYTNAIESCETAINNAEDKMVTASINDDSKSYIAAKKVKEDAEGEREMYQRRLAQIESEGLISNAETQRIISDLKEAEQDEFQTLAKELKEMASHIAELKHSYDNVLKELNDLNFLLTEIKPGRQLEPLSIRIGNPVFAFAAYAERFAENNIS